MISILKKIKSIIRPPLDKTARPSRIDIEICNVCNYHCTVCSTGNGMMNRPKEFLSKDGFKEILSKLDGDQLSTVVLNCIGEPFLNNDIYSILKIASSLGNKIIIPTNASVLDVSRLKEAREYITLIVSLDSIYYDAYTGYRRTTKSNYESAMKNILRLADAGIEFQISTLVSKYNENHLDDIKEYVNNLGVKHKLRSIHCSPYSVSSEALPAGVSKDDNYVGRRYIDPKDYYELAPQISKNLDYLKYEYDKEIDLFVDTRSFNSCSFVYSTWITSGGDILPCCFEAYYNTIKFGNIFSSRSLDEIWFSRKYINFRIGMADIARSSHGPCKICTKTNE